MSNTPNTNEIFADARDTSRRDWFKHTAMLAGLAATATIATRANAQDGSMTNDGMANNGMANNGMMNNGMMNNGMMPNDGMMMDGMMIMGQNDKMSMEMPPPPPMGDQAVANASIVASTKLNPNNPALTIPAAAKNASASDADILNFALGLEYLEATFYAQVVAANNARTYLRPEVARVAQGLANDEAAHVTAILDVLNRAGGTPVAKPAFQFPANVFISQIAFLDLAAIFEVTGTGAYLGAAPKLNSVDALKFAASIYGVETRHTGVIRMINGLNPFPTALEIPLEVPEVQRRVAPFIIM